jgi:hypothetical protein
MDEEDAEDDTRARSRSLIDVLLIAVGGERGGEA